MTLMELLQKLVETEDQMERMNLVEANKEMIDQLMATPANDGEDWKAKHDELKQKYISTFFNPQGVKDETPPSEEDTKTEEEQRAETIQIEDLLKGGN